MEVCSKAKDAVEEFYALSPEGQEYTLAFVAGYAAAMSAVAVLSQQEEQRDADDA